MIRVGTCMSSYVFSSLTNGWFHLPFQGLRSKTEDKSLVVGKALTQCTIPVFYLLGTNWCRCIWFSKCKRHFWLSIFTRRSLKEQPIYSRACVKTFWKPVKLTQECLIIRVAITTREVHLPCSLTLLILEAAAFMREFKWHRYVFLDKTAACDVKHRLKQNDKP